MPRIGYRLIAATRFLIMALAASLVGAVGAAADTSITPFQVVRTGSMAAGTEGLNLAFTVPKGKTLVVEYVSGTCFVPSGQSCVMSILTQIGGAVTGTPFNLQTLTAGPFGGGETLFRAGQPAKLYADGGTIVTLRADRNASTGTAKPIAMSLSGYLIKALED
jgi:hypothetical protein